MPLDKFGRHYHNSSQRIHYKVLKVKGKLYYCTFLNIPCVKRQSRYTFPLQYATVLEAVRISVNDDEVQLFINNIRIKKVDELKRMVLKYGDVLDISHTSDQIVYVQLLLKCPMHVE